MNLSNIKFSHVGCRTFLLTTVVGLALSISNVRAQNDVIIGQYYRLNLQRQTDHADGYILHNAKVDAAASAVFRWETTHPTFGSRGIVFSYSNGIQFFADADERATKGIQLGEMNMLLLKKVEELTLYVIQLEKQNQRQDSLI